VAVAFLVLTTVVPPAAEPRGDDAGVARGFHRFDPVDLRAYPPTLAKFRKGVLDHCLVARRFSDDVIISNKEIWPRAHYLPAPFRRKYS
jgi:hypothetical protein